MTLNNVEFRNLELREQNLAEIDFSNSQINNSTFTKCRIIDADFSETEMRNARFDEGEIRNTDFTKANLLGSDFVGVESKLTDFEDSNLLKLNLKNSVFMSADFTDANAQGATLDNSNLEDATFIRTELRDASLKNTRLYQTLFSDVRINSNTDFGEESAYEDPDTELGENYDDTTRFEAAAWVYRRLQDLHEENAMSEQAREYHVRKEEAHRSNYWAKGQYFQWFVYTLNRYLTHHGESLKHVVAWSVGTILTCALAYPLAGGISTGNEVFRVGSGAALGGLFLRSLYFSTVTFTTHGYDDSPPVGPAAKALAGAESLAGALLVALFVFVLGRRVAR